MKTLLIMRHAKSIYPLEGVSDFDRPLNKRGRKDVRRMAKLLKSVGPLPELIFSSPAIRARQTAEGMATGLAISKEKLRFDDRLYLTLPENLQQIAGEELEPSTTALIVAHNPGLEEWLSQLCGGSIRLSTAALASVHLPIARWSEIQRSQGQLQWLITPRLIKSLVDF